jgi:hypothetical protein
MAESPLRRAQSAAANSGISKAGVTVIITVYGHVYSHV